MIRKKYDSNEKVKMKVIANNYLKEV